MSKIKVALLDMNNNQPNQGMRNITEIAEAFRMQYATSATITVYDVRYKNEIPKAEDYDIFISSGGPGNPHPENFEWEKPYYELLDSIWKHNMHPGRKKFLFLICHSFQIACIHWKLGNICKRQSYSFGILPIFKTHDGREDELLANLPEPFYAVDSRAFQFIEPDLNLMKKLKMKIVSLEKSRPHISLERAVMAVRFSQEIFGTQFHPEADPEGMLENLQDPKNKNAMISGHGLEKYKETLDRIDDADKIILTQAEILPRFLAFAAEKLLADCDSNNPA